MFFSLLHFIYINKVKKGGVLNEVNHIDEHSRNVIYIVTEEQSPSVNQRCTMPQTSNEMLDHLSQTNGLLEGLQPHLQYHCNIVSKITILIKIFFYFKLLNYR